MDISLLQNHIKKDPEGYKKEFLSRHEHFLSLCEVYKLKKPTSEEGKTFGELVLLIANVSVCYRGTTKETPEKLASLLQDRCVSFEPGLRLKLVKAMIVFRKKELYDPFAMLSLVFTIFRLHDKPLRKLCYSYAVSDIITLSKRHDKSLTSRLEKFLMNMINDSNELAATKAQEIMIDLFKKNIWKDEKNVNIIINGIFSNIGKVVVATLRFLLGTVQEEEEEEEKHDKTNEIKSLEHKDRVSRTTRSKKRKMVKVFLEHKKHKSNKKLQPCWPALFLIHNPQRYCERVFGVLKHTKESFEVRIMLMSLISRLIFAHKLLVLNFYPFLERYLFPHQEHITKILVICAESCHDIVPPETVHILLKKIIDNFVNDKSSNEAITVGISTIREISVRSPYAMSKEMLRDIALYRKSHDRAIRAAAENIVHLFRKLNPSLLSKKDRGRNFKSINALEYGQTKVLEMKTRERNENEENEEQGDDNIVDDDNGDDVEMEQENGDDDDDDSSDEIKEKLETNDITWALSKKKQNKQERIETMKEGRDPNAGKHGRPSTRGKTNAVKNRNKPFLLSKPRAQLKSLEKQTFGKKRKNKLFKGHQRKKRK